MYGTAKCMVLAGLMLASVSSAFGHDEDLRAGRLKKTIGVISNEVTIARLRTAGVQNPTVVRKQGNKIFLRGVVQGRQSEIELDILSGHAVEAGPGRRLLIGPKGALAQPIVRGTQVPIDHRALSDPRLMDRAVVPQP